MKSASSVMPAAFPLPAASARAEQAGPATLSAAMTRIAWIAAAALAASTAAGAQELRDFCPDRPGLGTPPCTMDAGHADVEVGLADWTLERSAGERTDTLALGETLVRVGLTDHLEAQVGWTAFGHVRERGPGGRSSDSGVGDVTVALRRNLANPDGSGFSVALMPYATLPTGNAVLGAGDWSAGLLVPVSYELPHGLQLGFTGQVEAAVDEDRRGRHLAYGGIVGMSADLSDKLSATAELSGVRDDDPSGHSTELLAGLSAGWMAREDLQLDVGANIGLNEAAPDVQLYAGISKRF